MNLRFSKYHGTGNDFIMIDNRSSVIRDFDHAKIPISNICHRRFGIGADGLILLNKSTDADFAMVYFNSDGLEGSMCGNGGRCIVAFAYECNVIKEETVFEAMDGMHEAFITGRDKEMMLVKLKMQDVSNIKQQDDHFILNTGSPHYITFLKDVAKMDVVKNGSKIRYSKSFKEHGINVNFAEPTKEGVIVRTYERGVEDETLSCGTGAVATAIAATLAGVNKHKNHCFIQTPGGNLQVSFKRTKKNFFHDIWLEGFAKLVFKGEINLDHFR